MRELLNRAFHWFYCLPMTDAIVLTIVLSALFLVLNESANALRGWKAIKHALLLGWTAVILIGTLNRGESLKEPCWIPFYSYKQVMNGGNIEILRSNLMNVILFYPAGLFAGVLCPKRWNKFLWGALLGAQFVVLSVGIEWMQYSCSLGYCEMDDMIHNGLGVFLGLTVSLIPMHKLYTKMGIR